MAGNHTLGTIRGTIEIDYDGAGIVKATKDSDKARIKLEGLGGASDKTLAAFGKFVGGALKVSGAIGAVYNGLTLVSSVLAVVAPLTAAAFAAAPALVLGWVAALSVAKIAVSGVGDALKLAGDDAEKFNKALEGLSPEAQKFAKAYRAALPVLQAVQDRMQDAFFRNSAGQVGKVVDRVASLGAQATGVAGALGRVVKEIVRVVTSNKALQNMREILSGVTAFLLRIQKDIGPVIAAFINLAAQGAKFGGLVGGKLSTALQALAGWLNSIDIQAVFANAMPILQALGGLFTNIFTIVSHLVGLFNVDGASAVGILSEMVAQLAAFLDSAQGQEVLAALGEAIQSIAGASGQIFLAFLQAVTPVIIALAPGVAELAGQISGLLVPALAAVSPILQSVATFLSENMSWIGPLAGGIVALAAAYKVYSAVAKGVAAVQALLAASAVKSTAAWIANTASVVANRIAVAAMAVVSGVVRAATIAWTAVQWLLNVALTANPIGIVIIAVAALIAAIILLWKNSETFRNIVMAVWKAIKIAIAAVVDWFTGTIVPSLKRAWDTIVAGVKWVWNIWTGYWKLIFTVVQTIWNTIVSLIKRQIQNVKNTVAAVKIIYNYLRDAFNRGVAAVRTAIGNIITAVKGIPNRVSSALGNIGRLLYNKGVSLVQGFINGIAGMIGRVRDTAKRVVSAVTDFLPGSPAKEGPLSGRGYALLRARRMMEDFGKGMNDRVNVPVGVMMSAVSPMSRAMALQPSTGRSAASTTGATPTPAWGGTREYNINIGDRTFATMVLDAVTGEPRAVAKTVTEGNRRSAWAGSGRK